MRVKATHCKNGHEFTESNTLHTTDGRRGCRACKNEYRRLYRNPATREAIRKNKEVKRKKLSIAIDAYCKSESALSLEVMLGLPNQSLYRYMAKIGITQRKIRPKGTVGECWCCRGPLTDSRKKVCAKEECQKTAGFSVPWSAKDLEIVERAAAAGLTTKNVAWKLPARTYYSVKHQLRHARRRLAASPEMARAA